MELTDEQWREIERGLKEPFDPKEVPGRGVVGRLRKLVCVDTQTGCWVWRGTRINTGYGKITIWTGDSKDDMLAHRWVWTLRHGPIPAGLEIDHVCRNRQCCNPSHLELVTHSENNRRSWAAREKAIACRNGHVYSEVGLYRYPDGRRECIACRAEQQSKWRKLARLTPEQKAQGFNDKRCRRGHLLAEVGWYWRSDNEGRRCRQCQADRKALKASSKRIGEVCNV